jgi:hypothetical protein
MIKRTIMSRLYGLGHHGTKTVVNPRLPKTILQRDYAGKFKASRIRTSLTDNEKQRLGITQHEAKHLNVIYQKTEKVEGILTSVQNKNKNAAGGSFYKIDSVKVNGTFTPKIDPNTKKPVFDTDGNTVPNPDKGGQYMATLSTPRQVGSDTKHLYHVNKYGQSYVDKHEKAIEDNINKNRKPTIPKNIGFIDDE